MKRIEELTKEDYQIFLDEMFEKSVEFKGLVDVEGMDEHYQDQPGIEYKVKKGGQKGFVDFSNPELIIWLYEHDVDITVPLQKLRYDFMEMDETNSTLFEYVMNINSIVGKYKTDEYNENQVGNYMMKSAALDEIKKLQKNLVNKL